ncbi:MAG: hypothetical protein MJ159_03405 [Treponemataceae bacterium]|nr:hypothetical protein [Treponemataceae bacterium]
MNIKEIQNIEEWIENEPDAKFCLHNGFSGFSFGSPVNPIFIDTNFAIKYLNKLLELENKKLGELIYINCINIEKILFDFPELKKAGYRFIGLVKENQCTYEKEEK